jgi:hypothetical protein
MLGIGIQIIIHEFALCCAVLAKDSLARGVSETRGARGTEGAKTPLTDSFARRTKPQFKHPIH